MEMIAGGPSGATRGEGGDAVFDGEAAGAAETSGAALRCEAGETVPAGSVVAAGACEAVESGDGEAVAAALEDGGAEQALVETSNVAAIRASGTDGNRKVIGVSISLPAVRFSARDKKRDTPPRRNRVR
jgi:hypothetical protein